MNASPVIAIGLDAAEPTLVERWMEEGHLPTLAHLRRQGDYQRLRNFELCRAEAACTSFLTGCAPSTTGKWGSFKLDRDYGISELFAYEFDRFPPFYALAQGRRSIILDIPQTRLHQGVEGVQVLGWGAHSPMTKRQSVPENLVDDLIARHGEHPAYEKDHVAVWDDEAMAWLKDALLTGIRRRALIARDLLTEQPCDLFLTYFGETHSAGHFFWHLNDPSHPLFDRSGRRGNPLRDVYQAVDQAVARILDAAPAGARVIVFSDHGMESNNSDLPSLVFLPELLYRWNFPGRRGLEAKQTAAPAPPLRPRKNRSWTDEVWAQKHDPNPITRTMRRTLPVVFFHYAVERRLGLTGVPLCPEDCALGHEPPMWYRPEWPQMKAFALPSFSEGYVRLNVKGREAQGMVEPRDYGATCDEITRLLHEMRDARTGRPMVAKVVRSRRAAGDPDANLPDADLLVLWAPHPTDTADTPAGRIGPLPFQRTGSHVERGFVLASGRGLRLAPAAEPHALDLAPTILSLLDVPVPPYMEGRPLCQPAHAAGPSGSAVPPAAAVG
jgi:predicted AlkP superfamily phosphohydrolase/phosphomutase